MRSAIFYRRSLRFLGSARGWRLTISIVALGHPQVPHRIVLFAFDLLHHDGRDMRRTPLIGGHAALRKLIEPDPRSLIQFSDHFCGVGTKFFKAAAELGLEGIISKRGVSLYQSGPSCSWVKTKNMIGGRVRGARH